MMRLKEYYIEWLSDNKFGEHFQVTWNLTEALRSISVSTSKRHRIPLNFSQIEEKGSCVKLKFGQQTYLISNFGWLILM